MKRDFLSAEAHNMIADRLLALRIRFLDVLRQRLTEIEAQRDRLEAGGPDDAVRCEHVRAICFAAHKTVGVAATLGFADLGLLSQRVELACTDLLARTEPPTTVRMVLALTDDMLDEMALILAEAGAEGSPAV